LREAGGYHGSNVWTGFTRIRADKGVRRGVVTMKVFGDGAAEGKERSVVEGRNSRDTADAVCSEELSGHRFARPSGLTDKKFSTAIAEDPGEGRRMC